MKWKYCMPLPVVIILGYSLVLLSMNKFNSLSYISTHHRNPTPGKGEERGRFLYMYNVAQCLPLDLLTNETLLDAATHDILVLSYKLPCTRKDPSHLQYIYTGNKTTWGEGRNLLFK